MKIQRVFSSTVIIIAVLSLACAALAISWPEWREDLTAEGYYGYGYGFFLPDTGQTKCYRGVHPYDEIPCAGTGQDGEYDINPMSYTDNEDGTVTDNNTGLMWQKCSVGQNNDAACSGTAFTYNWDEASGTYHAAWNPTSQDICGALTTGNYSDWRLPTRKELITIVDYSIPYPGPTINTVYFPDTVEWYYWSSTNDANYPGYAWDVSFATGYVTSGGKGNDAYVKCVRGGAYPEQDLVDNQDGTVTDNATDLMWQQGEPGAMSWASALSYCENLELPSGSGQTDWHLPSIKEIESIVDNTIYDPDNQIVIDRNFFPNAYARFYWSSTTYPDVYNYHDRAWYMRFDDSLFMYFPKNPPFFVSFYVRCVRGSVDYYCDDDSDGYIDSQIDGTCVGDGCVFEGCQITSGTDCNDSDPLAHQNQTWYKDMDNDLYSSGDMTVQCSRPAGYKLSSELRATSGDCNDSNPLINPGVKGSCLPTVTVTANDPTATEAGPTTGQFTFTRTGATTSPLMIYFVVSGTATAYSDYNSIGTNVTIPAGSASVTKTVTPINDTKVETNETVVVTLSAAAYKVGPDRGIVTIESDDVFPTVTITANDPTATEAGLTTGQFTITRTGPTTSSLTVYYTRSGTAASGSDFISIGTYVTIPAGSASVTKTVTPINDNLVESNETVKVTLNANAAYAVGSPSNATVTITSDDVLPTVTITSNDPTATEAGPTTGQFTITRTGPTTSSLTVYYTRSGTAASGSDFNSIGTSVMIPAGSASVTKTVTPINDTAVESNETVVVTLSANATYTVGSPNSGTVTITSNE